MKQLRDRVAVVTGAGSGLGRALAVELGRQGCILAISDVDLNGLGKTASIVEAVGARVSLNHLDVADREEFERYAERVVQELGRVNLVINNAGVALSARICEMTFEEMEWVLGINLWGVVYGTKTFLPYLEQADEGHIVNISSIFGIVAIPGNGAYHLAKFGVRGFTECLREELELAGSRVSCTCVHPGGIRTNIASNVRIGERRASPPDRKQIVADFDRLARTSAEAAARKIVRAVRRNARRVLIGSDARLADWIQRCFPTAYQRAAVALARRYPGLI